MNIISIIDKKRLGKDLNYEELEYAFMGYLNNQVKDYQMSSLLMAICIQSLNVKETLDLCDIFIKSGIIYDLSSIKGIKVDKHSTGGIGDKTTLIIGSIVASCGLYMPKTSGRGLGITGGTIDKLESIKGFRTNLSKDEFIKQVRDVGFAITSQTCDMTPLDKIIYSLRDVTATTESIPLIAVSIMSKKIASNADKILIDIKVGNGALIKSQKEAKKLANLMKLIGKKYQKQVKIIMSDMNAPLGYNIGNTLEIMEVIDVLSLKTQNRLLNLSIDLASNLVSMGKNISYNKAYEEVLESLNSKKALNKFYEMVSYQGGDIKSLKLSNKKREVYASKTGKIKKIDALSFGKLMITLGANRLTKDDNINHEVGVILNYEIGDKIKKGDILCTIYYSHMFDDDIDSFFVIE